MSVGLFGFHSRAELAHVPVTRVMSCRTGFEPWAKGQDAFLTAEALLAKYVVPSLRAKVAQIRLVDGEDLADLECLHRLWALNANGESRLWPKWNVLLDGMRGSLALMLSTGFMVDNLRVGFDSSFCEWAYVMNLDDGTFDVYRGKQREPGEGQFQEAFMRQAGGAPEIRANGYFPISRVAAIPFAKLGSIDHLDAFLVECMGIKEARKPVEFPEPPKITGDDLVFCPRCKYFQNRYIKAIKAGCWAPKQRLASLRPGQIDVPAFGSNSANANFHCPLYRASWNWKLWCKVFRRNERGL